MPLESHPPCRHVGRAPSYPRVRMGWGRRGKGKKEPTSKTRGTYHETDTWHLSRPQEVKKTSASQQEISNHFSDTKATGIRCRSEEEGLQQTEKWASGCWSRTGRQAGRRVRPATGTWLLEWKRVPGTVMLSFTHWPRGKGPSPSL